MLFNSYLFIFAFLPIVLSAFFFSARYSHQFALTILLFASLIFYGWMNYHYLVPILFSITTNYLITIGIQTTSQRKLFLCLGIIFNLVILAYYKYTDFFIENINLIFGSHIPLTNIILPIGISFFTFTQIAFIVDCYKGLVQKCRPLNYALFVTYFPHLIAGPIIHHKEIMPQFGNDKTFKFNDRNFILGISIFALGLIKKTLIADDLGNLVSPVFDMSIEKIAFSRAWIAALAYTFEIYFDFSGYSDMAIGLSLLIGIKLPVNFYSPYKSVSIIEFWRRWNISLSRFLRDYLYFSLGGNKKGPYRRYINLMITMLLGGLWHGASWTFVLWGFLHGLYLCINHSWRALKTYFSMSINDNFIIRLISGIFTFIPIVIAWVYFRSPSFSAANNILYAMFYPLISLNELEPIGIFKSFFRGISGNLTTEQAILGWIAIHTASLRIIAAGMIIWFLPNSYELFKKYKPAILSYKYHHLMKSNMLIWKPKLVWNYFIVLTFVVGVLHIHSSSIFLYFKF